MTNNGATMTNAATSLGRRLKYARERAGLTMAQVRERTAIGESSLSDFENDKREPSISQLSAVGQCYRRSVSFFLSDEPIPKEVVLWRQRPVEGAEAIEAQFLGLCEQYHNLELWSGRKASCALPDAQGEASAFDFSQAAELARKVRRELALGDRPGLALLRVLEEDVGLKVFHLGFEPAGTAACALGPTFGASILLNANNVRWRRNFDLAHELFHLLTWKVFSVPDGDGAERPAKEESLADCFASNLLMPEEAVRSAVNAKRHEGKVPQDGLFDIARQFDVSVEALLWRIHWLFRSKAEKALTERDIERAKASARLYENREHAVPNVRPARFRSLAVSALRQGEIAIGRFAEYMGICRREAMSYVDSEQASDEEIELASA